MASKTPGSLRTHFPTRNKALAREIDALGRAVDPSGLAAYGQMLNGGTSRIEVAMQILTSVEGSQYRVGMDYQWLLQRSADPNGLGTYGNQLAQGGQEEAIVVTLLGSDEFFARH